MHRVTEDCKILCRRILKTGEFSLNCCFDCSRLLLQTLASTQQTPVEFVTAADTATVRNSRRLLRVLQQVCLFDKENEVESSFCFALRLLNPAAVTAAGTNIAASVTGAEGTCVS